MKAGWWGRLQLSGRIRVADWREPQGKGCGLAGAAPSRLRAIPERDVPGWRLPKPGYFLKFG